MKYLKTICLIAVICILLTGCGAGGHQNTTGSTKYTGSDVGLNCKNVTRNENSTVTTYIDFLFNTKDGYQMELYSKVIAKYDSQITDETYKKNIDAIASIKCINDENACKGSHLDLGITSLGFDTIVDRLSDTIEITYYNPVGKGYKAEQSDIDLAKSTYENLDYTCN